MTRVVFQPVLQHLGHQVADRLVLLLAPGSDLLDQPAGQIDRENRFGFRHGSQLLVALGLEEVPVGLAAGDALALHQSRQHGAGGLVSLQHPNRHIDSFGLGCQRGSGHCALYLMYYMSYVNTFLYRFSIVFEGESFWKKRIYRLCMRRWDGLKPLEGPLQT